jgi:hypothetical protein
MIIEHLVTFSKTFQFSWRFICEFADNLGRNPGLCALWEDERKRRIDRHLPPDLEPPGSPGKFGHWSILK